MSHTTKPVKVRIAPSPTGKMHMGTARTALFNKLFALANGGEYCVRIEDTDKARSTPENTAFIKDALTWLGLQPDNGEYVLQSANITAHTTAAKRLLAEGKAYTDDGAVRFKIPTGETSWHDEIQGKITYQNKDLEDFVILRSDGTPTYHLGVVVDDATMEITHIIRGDDHINNTPKQILLFEALGYPVPTFAHLPLIHGKDGGKLSKRHGAVSVQEFREAGILPNAMNHAMMMLSWLPGDDHTPRTLAEAGAHFSLADITKSPAKFDEDKLIYINNIYIQHTDNTELLRALIPFLPEIPSAEKKRLSRALPALKSRAKTLCEIAKAGEILLGTPPSLSAEDEEILANAREHMSALTALLTQAPKWENDALDTLVKSYITKNDLKFPAVGKPLRLALTGHAHGIGLGVLLYAFGKDEALKRLKAYV